LLYANGNTVKLSFGQARNFVRGKERSRPASRFFLPLITGRILNATSHSLSLYPSAFIL